MPIDLFNQRAPSNNPAPDVVPVNPLTDSQASAAAVGWSAAFYTWWRMIFTQFKANGR